MKHWFAAGLLSASIAASMTAQAQEEIQHQGLFADWYAGDSSTAVIVLHGTLAHKRMEIIETFASLLNEDYDFPVLAPNLALNQPDRPGMIDCAIPHDHTHMEAVDELTHGSVGWKARDTNKSPSWDTAEAAPRWLPTYKMPATRSWPQAW